MVTSNPPIYFHYLTPPFFFPDRTAIKLFLASIFKKHQKKIECVNYIFCLDKYLLTLNNKYLNHNTYTDIITFDLSKGKQIVADVYISVDRARENGNSFRVSFNNEILRLLIHGALHLCGFADKTVIEKQRMTRLENQYLKQYVSRETGLITH